MHQGVALVTGAGSGIGAAIARELSTHGLLVAINDLDADKANKVAEDIRATGDSAEPVPGNVADAGEARRVVEQAEALGDLAVLVNNVGIVRDAMLHRMSEEQWDQVLDVNLKSAFLCTQGATVGMVARGYGRVVNVASRAWLGSVGQANYSASKGGLVSLTRSTALELAERGITVNCVAPGLIDTPLIRSLPSKVQERLLAAQPTKTMGVPQDVANVVAFLASPDSQFVTGQVIHVCGGKSLGGIF